jgi:hypothetical protein
MIVTYHYILGCQLGFEFTDNEVDGMPISYLLIDLFCIRIQLAWYTT